MAILPQAGLTLLSEPDPRFWTRFPNPFPLNGRVGMIEREALRLAALLGLTLLGFGGVFYDVARSILGGSRAAT